METKDQYWKQDGKTVYCLHKTGKFERGGKPEECNRFYLSVQPDYAHGVTDEDAVKVAEYVCALLNSNKQSIIITDEQIDAAIEDELSRAPQTSEYRNSNEQDKGFMKIGMKAGAKWFKRALEIGKFNK